MQEVLKIIDINQIVNTGSERKIKICMWRDLNKSMFLIHLSRWEKHLVNSAGRKELLLSLVKEKPES
jgi:hypothetical protein